MAKIIKRTKNMIITEWEPETQAPAQPEPLKLVTADKHLTTIAKWERLGYISKTQADKLRNETIKRVVPNA